MSPFVLFEYVIALGGGFAVVACIFFILFLAFVFVRGKILQAEKN